MIENILAQRYASDKMRNIWSAKGKILLERKLWIAVMKAQKELGIDISDEAISAYEKVIDIINLDAINERERITKHDVKARIEEFCDLAGFEEIHKGMTSRDLTETVEQLQCLEALKLIRFKVLTCLYKLSQKAKKYENTLLGARTHNVIAQAITVGKRFSMFAEELLRALQNIDIIIANYPIRGIKGAVGTQIDQITLFEGDNQKANELDEKIRKHLAIGSSLKNVGQVYPRSLDFEVISSLVKAASAPSSFAKTLRIMAGQELASEGFAKGQTGSSAMPHKMNSRSCERINGFFVILKGYLEMASSLAGDQWNEGDVSCSVVRRVCLPDSFFAIDGLFETFITVLNQMVVNEKVIKKEYDTYLPFLLTTTVLMEAVKQGVGREEAHEIVKTHAVSTLNDLRANLITKNDLFERLANDKGLKLSAEKLAQILEKSSKSTGNASEQINHLISQVNKILETCPEAKDYTPNSIL